MSQINEASRDLDVGIGKTENPHAFIHQAISAIHQKYGVDFPCDTCVSSPETCMEEYSRRATLLPRVREETYQIIANQFGPDSDEANAARIVREIGDDFDAIFLFQLNQKERNALSWEGIDPEHSGHLAETIDHLLQDPELEQYFSTNPESREMLNLIKILTSAYSPVILKDTQLRLEQFTVSQYKRRKPVILFLLSDWYREPNRVSSDPIRILEPDCRLIFPYPLKEHQAIGLMVERDIRGLAEFFPVPKWSELPTGIVGTAVMWAGSQVASYTIGEALDGHGFVFAPNIIKSRGSIANTFARAGLALPKNLDELVFLLFSRHELAHIFDISAHPFLLELSADAPTVAFTLTEALGKDDKTLTAVIALLLGEYQMYANDPANGEATNDGYRISCLLILNKLFEYGLAEGGENGRIYIHQDRGQCRKLIKDLTQLHRRITAHDEETIRSLLLINPTDKVRQFLYH